MSRILVVGAGPTGLTLANCLARYGLKPRIIDRAEVPPADRSRAIVLQARTLELFEDLGIVDEVLANGLTFDSANFVLPSGKRGGVRFRPEWIDSRYNRIVSLPQDETERFLGEHLSTFGIAVERGVELTAIVEGAEAVTATLRHANGTVEQWDADWIVGCDGAHSGVRHATHIPFDGVTYRDECLLGDIQVEWELPEAELVLCPSTHGILLAFPLPGRNWYRIVIILPAKSASEDRQLSMEEFRARLEQMVPGKTPVIRATRFLTRYRLHRRGVPTYRKGRCFLAGDAAHIHSPVGAQGMNTGIQDAYNLGWKLALVCNGSANPAVLDSYNVERHRIGEFLLRNTDRMFAVLAGGGIIGRLLRHLAPTIALRMFTFPVVGRRLTRFISQTAIRYRRSPLTSEGPGASQLDSCAPRAGDRAPDVDLGDGRPLAPLLHGGAFHLLMFAGQMPQLCDRFAILAAELAQRYGALVGSVILRTGTPNAPTTVVDDGHSLAHRRYGAEQGALYLVRPDGYIAFRGGADDGDALRASLEKMLRPRTAV